MFIKKRKTFLKSRNKMREIKFRQAIFKNGKFSHWHYWGFINGNFVGIETNLSTVEEANLNSQQITGCKDKNGKEIYEGDIVLVLDWYKREVKFHAGSWWLFNNSKNDGLLFSSSFVEVVGNIFENNIEKEKGQLPPAEAGG